MFNANVLCSYIYSKCFAGKIEQGILSRMQFQKACAVFNILKMVLI